ncbi:MAG: glycosyltransferase family 2 protein [Actinomycetota bacterium]|nr:glycosyltransferase family 2 protein [Actinomycetota bacterium]
MASNPGAHLRTIVLVPAWNEEGSVGGVVRNVRRELPSATVLVIDDGSEDRTAAEAQAAGALVLQLPYNLGVGGAMRAGYRFAFRHGYQIAVQVDADGQHVVADLRRLIRRLDEADVVIGSRFMGHGNYDVRGPRRWAMRLLASVLSLLARTRLTDTTSGFRATNRAAIALFARNYPIEYLGDTVESLVDAARVGLRIAEEPVAMVPRATGRSSQSSLRATAYLLRAVLVLILATIRRPIQKVVPS